MARNAPRRRDTPLTRQVIVDAARMMLSEGPLEDLSLRRLAATLEVTAPALYAHFQDKDDLLRAVSDSGFVELLERFEHVDHPEPVVRLRSYVRAYVDQAVADPELFRVMFRFRPGALDLPNVNEPQGAADEGLLVPIEAIRAAIGIGEIHPERDPVDTAVVMWTVAHGCAAILLLTAQDGRVTVPNGFENLVEETISVALAGLRHPPVDPTHTMDPAVPSWSVEGNDGQLSDA